MSNASQLGCREIVEPGDIAKGNQKVNTLFIAELFKKKHGLEALEAIEVEAFNYLDLDDAEGSSQEKAFRYLINSLGINDVFINNLYQDLRDGLKLC